MNDRPAEAVKKIIPFAQAPVPGSKDNIPFAPKAREPRAEPRSEGDPVDRSGQAIVALLQEAAESATVNCDRAMDMAHKLSIQLRAAEERVRELELEMRRCQDHAQCAAT